MPRRLPPLVLLVLVFLGPARPAPAAAPVGIDDGLGTLDGNRRTPPVD